jgi:hypothetical protein
MGVRARLLLAFLAIAAFAVVGAAAALLAFSEVREVFDRVTREGVPAGFAALELSRHAERIGSYVPWLLAGATLEQRMQTDRKIRRELAELDKLSITP